MALRFEDGLEVGGEDRKKTRNQGNGGTVYRAGKYSSWCRLLEREEVNE
jgi:hypothetical protein